MIAVPSSAETIAPMLARIRQVPAASVAMATHFSHRPCSIGSMRLLLNLAAPISRSTAPAGASSTLRSIWSLKRPKERRGGNPAICTTSPAGDSVAKIPHSPPSTRSLPKRSRSTSICAMPFSSGRTRPPPAFMCGAAASIADWRSYDLQVRITRSNGWPGSAAVSVRTRSVASPTALLITRPFSASCRARRSRTRNVTSAPDSTSRPPKYPPTPPAPMTRTFTMHSASLWSPLMASDLIRLKNIGPASVRQLREVGIEDEAALRKLGAIAAYRRLKHAFPREVSLVMLYALEGALRGCHWNQTAAGRQGKAQGRRETALIAGPASRTTASPAPSAGGAARCRRGTSGAAGWRTRRTAPPSRSALPRSACPRCR